MVCVHPGMRAGLPELGAAFTTDRVSPGGHARRVLPGRAAPAATTRAPGRPGLDADPRRRPAAGFADEGRRRVRRAAWPRRATRPAATATATSWPPGCAASRCPAGRCPEHQYAAAWFSGLTREPAARLAAACSTPTSHVPAEGTHFGGGGESRPLRQFRRAGGGGRAVPSARRCPRGRPATRRPGHSAIPTIRPRPVSPSEPRSAPSPAADRSPDLRREKAPSREGDRREPPDVDPPERRPPNRRLAGPPRLALPRRACSSCSCSSSWVPG